MSSNKVVLLLEEDKNNEKVLTEFLEDNGYEVLHAARERECYHYLASRHIDLVLLDIQRDDLEGMMLTKRIKSLSKHRHTPVISVVVQNKVMSHPFNLSWGCDEYISRPIDKEKLIDMINTLIDRYFY